MKIFLHRQYVGSLVHGNHQFWLKNFEENKFNQPETKRQTVADDSIPVDYFESGVI